MAKKSHIARDAKRRKASELAESKRQSLRQAIANELDFDAREKLVHKLDNMPRNTSRIRVRHRCRCCGRPRGVYQKFKMCRLCLRKFVTLALVPGLRKASW